MLGVLKKINFLLVVANFCWIDVQSWSKYTILHRIRSKKTIEKQKWMTGCLFSKWLRLFVYFFSMIVSIFYRIDAMKTSTHKCFYKSNSGFIFFNWKSLKLLDYFPTFQLSLDIYKQTTALRLNLFTCMPLMMASS